MSYQKGGGFYSSEGPYTLEGGFNTFICSGNFKSRYSYNSDGFNILNSGGFNTSSSSSGGGLNTFSSSLGGFNTSSSSSGSGGGLIPQSQEALIPPRSRLKNWKRTADFLCDILDSEEDKISFEGYLEQKSISVGSDETKPPKKNQKLSDFANKRGRGENGRFVPV
jgi:hypothetical protein